MGKKRLPQGMIQVYTGNGKGKTTAALGLACRAVGHGYRVFVIPEGKLDDDQISAFCDDVEKEVKR